MKRLLLPSNRLSAAVFCGVAILFEVGAVAQGKYTDIGRRVSPAVVKLDAFDAQARPLGLGSGFVVDSRGLIVTNYHVIKGAHAVKVTSAAGDVYNVEGVVAFDAEKDFACVVVRAFDLPVVVLGNSNQVEVLEEVIAIGHSMGLPYTSSTGVISGRRDKDGFKMLQMTAPISPGNSGGPLVNLRGEVIGVVTEQMGEGQNLNFALPINEVRAWLSGDIRPKFTLAQLAAAEAERDAKRPVPAQAAHDQWERQVLGQLRDALSMMEDEGFELTHQIFTGALRNDQSAAYDVQFTEGTQYMILGVCDNDCTDIDLVLKRGTTTIVEDRERDDTPLLTLPRITRSGALRLEIVMFRCASEPCRYGIGIFGR